jgi:hypothetical protein
MTSWIRTDPAKKRDPIQKSYYLECTGEPFTAQCLTLFYAHLTANANGAPLLVADRNNTVGTNFPLFRSVFADVSGVAYVDGRQMSSTALTSRTGQLVSFANSISVKDLRAMAEGFFTPNAEAAERIRSQLASVNVLKAKKGTATTSSPLPATGFDAAIAISSEERLSTAERRATYLQSYIGALRDIQSRRKLKEMSVFFYAEDADQFQEFTRLMDPSWTVYSFLPSPVQQSARASGRSRIDSFYQMIVELSIVQGCDAIACSLTHSLGKFLYLTGAAVGGMGILRSIDTPTFTA